MSQTPRQSPVSLMPERPASATRDRGLPVDVPRLRLVPPVARDPDGYPCGDGAPMAENQLHLNQMIYAISALQAHYRRWPGVCVLGDVFINYREGDRDAAVAPDVYVAFGAQDREDRLSYKVWEEPKPTFVMEMLSPSTKRRDMEKKREIYRWMGVEEYWLPDPFGKWIAAHLRGYRLTEDGEFEEIAGLGSERYRSKVLGLLMWDEGGSLRLHDPRTGRDLASLEESAAAREVAEEARDAAEARAAREAAAREAAEARIAALEALLRKQSPSEGRG